MNDFSLNIEYEVNSDRKDIEIILVVLRSGRSVKLRTNGFSMFPTLRPGDKVTVNPVVIGSKPGKGDVVVFMGNGELVMHRLVEIPGSNLNNVEYVTRGDSMPEPDPKWPSQNLLGIAVSYKRRVKERCIRPKVPGRWQYKLNYFRLWTYIKMKKFRSIFIRRKDPG